ncbi:MAG: radical SAM protein [Thermotogae bacterium]|nr:radical SAM protein [Thermotogota bacterium]
MRKPRRTLDWKEYENINKYASSEKRLKKFSTEGYLKVALIYPNSYKTLAGNLGFHRVFEVANSIPGVSCERFFYDKRFNRFYSLDSLRPLDEFKIWMFSISYELDFFNLMDILKKLRIPLLVHKRGERHPLIVIGGPLVTINPNLFVHIADIIYHGEAEVNLSHLLSKISESLHKEKEKLLKKVSELENISVPILNKMAHEEAIYRDVIHDPAGSVFLSKFGEFGDVFLIEVGRGCFRGCKFCTIGNLYGYFRPIRVGAFIKKVEDTLSQIDNIRDFKMGLVAPAVNDHPKFDEILDYLERRNIRFSLSSLRVDKIDEKLLKGLLRSGQNMLTIAPETGSEKMREFLNKNISDEEIYDKVSMARKLGFKKIKLYLMIGLPEETKEDLELSAKMIDRISSMGFNEIVISVNPFVPKPGTPLENHKFLSIKELLEKQEVLKVKLKNVKVNFESLRESFIQYKLDHLDSRKSLKVIQVFDANGKQETFKLLKEMK